MSLYATFLLAYALLQLADIVTTMEVLKWQGANEANPIVRGLATMFSTNGQAKRYDVLLALVLTKGAITVLLVPIDLPIWAMVLILVMLSAVVASNLRILRKFA